LGLSSICQKIAFVFHLFESRHCLSFALASRYLPFAFMELGQVERNHECIFNENQTGKYIIELDDLNYKDSPLQLFKYLIKIR